MFGIFRSAVTALALFLATPAFAGDIILTVSGDVAEATQGDDWIFDVSALRALPKESFDTTTIWTEGNQRFDGVPLVALLDHVGAAKGMIRAIALNDYAVSIPSTDAVSNGPIVAYARNGAEMSIRDKGPLWIVYPFDDNETYKSEEYYSRSIWQLDRIEIAAAE